MFRHRFQLVLNRIQQKRPSLFDEVGQPPGPRPEQLEQPGEGLALRNQRGRTEAGFGEQRHEWQPQALRSATARCTDRSSNRVSRD